MSAVLKMRVPLRDIIDLPIDPNIFVKVYDTNYSVNIKIYQKETPMGTELFVNVDLDTASLPGLYDDYEAAVYKYIREHLRLSMEYDQGETRYFVTLRNYR
ncbi:hypothetical protein [Culicoidibacter larvae]|nr:hypothetical protein [Culicoidibacter larvae]